jgi:hypothetical protein
MNENGLEMVRHERNTYFLIVFIFSFLVIILFAMMAEKLLGVFGFVGVLFLGWIWAFVSGYQYRKSYERRGSQ